MSRVYYNEIDGFACEWLYHLMQEGAIAKGDIDNRDIKEVQPHELEGYDQCHFFAGIGGWAYALELAGWGARPVWTGSCPCQPFSSTGNRKGFDDERHLWPDFHRLIRAAKPDVCFGEQVSGALAERWITAVENDMETDGYLVGSLTFTAYSVGALHERKRLYWVADSASEFRVGWRSKFGSNNSQGDQEIQERYRGIHGPENGGEIDGGWSEVEWRECWDGKWRLIKPGLSPLAHGIPGRVEQIRGYGNAIVPQQAAEFIKAYMSL